MRKKTAPRTRKHRKASSPQQSGLIAKGKTAQQSATTRSALDNRSHRTDQSLGHVWISSEIATLPPRGPVPAHRW
jgi:hypothetical protein